MPVSLDRRQHAVRRNQCDRALVPTAIQGVERIKRCQSATDHNKPFIACNPVHPIAAPGTADQCGGILYHASKRPVGRWVAGCQNDVRRRYGNTGIKCDSPSVAIRCQSHGFGLNPRCRSCPGPGFKLFGHICSKITAPVKVAGIACRFGVVSNVLSGPAGEIEPPVWPDAHQFGSYVQPEIVIHAAKGLPRAKLAMPYDGDRTAINALVIQMQQHGCRAEAAADDADVAAHTVVRPQRRRSAVAVKSSRAVSIRSNMSVISASFITSGGQKPMMSPGSARRMTPCS